VTRSNCFGYECIVLTNSKGLLGRVAKSHIASLITSRPTQLCGYCTYVDGQKSSYPRLFQGQMTDLFTSLDLGTFSLR